MQSDLTHEQQIKTKPEEQRQTHCEAAASVQTGQGCDGILFFPLRPRN